MYKIHDTAGDALEGLLFDGMHIAAGGFGLCGIPELLIGTLSHRRAKSPPGTRCV